MIVSLDWSPDGSSLFCGSFDGEIRSCQNRKWHVIQERLSVGHNARERSLADLAWSEAANALIVSTTDGLAIYGNAAGLPLMIPEIGSAVMLRCSAKQHAEHF
jgi:WD40 repeat protein